MTPVANVILDLDGTIVFPENAEIAIPGRSHPSYISASTASLLKAVGANGNLYLATARSAASVAHVVRALPQVSFAGFVLECGLVWKTNINDPQGVFAQRDALCEALKSRLPDWEHVGGYEQMICCIAPPYVENPTNHVATILCDVVASASWQMHQERHKTFLYPNSICKVSGLRKLGVAEIDFAAGDDARYDHGMLAIAGHPLTLQSADESIINLVQSRRGFVAPESSHAGANALLFEIAQALVRRAPEPQKDFLRTL